MQGAEGYIHDNIWNKLKYVKWYYISFMGIMYK